MPTVRICITSPHPGNDRLADILTAKSMTVWQMPLIEYAPPHDDYAALDHAITELSVYTHVALTSPHTVTVFADRLKAHGDAPIGHLKFAVVGKATAALCAEYGFSVHLMPAQSTSQALGELLRPQVTASDRILFPQVEAGRPEFVAAMATTDAEVTIVPAYCTRPTAIDTEYWKQQLTTEPWQGLVATSPRGLRVFLDTFGHGWCHDVMTTRALFVMGTTTAQSAGYLGFERVQIPEQSTLESLGDCIQNYFAASLG